MAEAPGGMGFGGGRGREVMRRAGGMAPMAAPGGAGMAPAAAMPQAALAEGIQPQAPPPGMAERNFQFGAKPAQQLDRNQDLMFKERELRLGEVAKGKDVKGRVELKLEQGLEKQKLEKEMKVPALGMVEERDKRGLLEDGGKAVRGGAIKAMQPGFAPGKPGEDRRKMMGGMMGGSMLRVVAPPALEPFMIREYAHLHTHG